MKIKYQRTSTLQQHGDRFNTDEDNYDLIFFDKGISGTRPFKERTESAKIVNLVNKGKVKHLVVEELRDIGRNTVDSIVTLDWLNNNGVNVEIKSLGINSLVNGKPNQVWGIITSVMSSLYQMELENLKTRTEMGRIAYLNKGGKLGRAKGSNETIKKFLSKPKSIKIISLLNQGKSTRDIAGRLNVSTTTVVKVRKYITLK